MSLESSYVIFTHFWTSELYATLFFFFRQNILAVSVAKKNI